MFRNHLDQINLIYAFLLLKLLLYLLYTFNQCNTGPWLLQKRGILVSSSMLPIQVCFAIVQYPECGGITYVPFKSLTSNCHYGAECKQHLCRTSVWFYLQQTYRGKLQLRFVPRSLSRLLFDYLQKSVCTLQKSNSLLQFTQACWSRNFANLILHRRFLVIKDGCQCVAGHIRSGMLLASHSLRNAQ